MPQQDWWGFQNQSNQANNGQDWEQWYRNITIALGNQIGTQPSPIVATQPLRTARQEREEQSVPASVSYLDIDKYLAKKPRNRVSRVGVELEGAWAQLPTLAPGMEFTGDGSVFPSGPPPGCTKKGELPIGPYQPGALPLALKKYYPTAVDKTCGMHVHMSFDSVYQYSILADSPQYQETVLEYMTRWAKEEGLPASHCIWGRFKGENTYCQKKFWPAEQMRQKNKSFSQAGDAHRYTMIHYCWERKRTIECRLLPMMDTPTVAWRAIKRLIEVTNAYLLAAEKSSHKIKESGKVSNVTMGGTHIKMTLKKGEVYEETVEEI